MEDQKFRRKVDLGLYIMGKMNNREKRFIFATDRQMKRQTATHKLDWPFKQSHGKILYAGSIP